MDGQIAWDQELEHWKNHLHEVSILRCNMMTNLLRCVSSEVGKLPYYGGLTDVDMFLDEFEYEFPEDHHFQALELELRTTPAQWWGTHKDSFFGWRDYRRMMKL